MGFFWSPDGGGGGGDPAPASEVQILAQAAVNLSGHRAVRYDATGRLVYASADALDDADTVIGITKRAVVGGGSVEVITHGQVLTETTWAWEPGNPIFLREDGMLSQVPPVSGVVCIVGIAESSTQMLVDPKISVCLVDG